MMGHKDIAAKCQHINFGLVLGMSTRKGKQVPKDIQTRQSLIAVEILGTVKFLDVSSPSLVVPLASQHTSIYLDYLGQTY